MQLHAEKAGLGDQNINVSVPPTRSDILHPCDVMEVMIAKEYYSAYSSYMERLLGPLLTSFY